MPPSILEQYQNWIYPLPVQDMRLAIDQRTYREIGDPTEYWPLIWPHARSVQDGLTILCAGCGSNQATYYACRHPNSRVIGIDISAPSLDNQRVLKERHGLANLELHELDLLKVAELDLAFDFITCTGVLHHMPDPDTGLKALASVLRPDGVMNLMVYGQSLRMGVYPLQEAFRLMQVEQVKDDVDLIKTILDTLPPDHAVHRYIKHSGDLVYDAGIVDTFLNPLDRAFWVKDVYAFTRRAGLEFLNWCEPAEYSLRAQIPAEHPIWQKLEALSPEDAHHVCDLLLQARGTHRWLAAHPDYVKRNRIPEDESFFHCTARLTPGATFLDDADDESTQTLVYARGNLNFEISRDVLRLIELSATGRSIGSLVNELSPRVQGQDPFKVQIQKSLKELHEMGHIQILLP